jgi:hypothetical protein
MTKEQSLAKQKVWHNNAQFIKGGAHASGFALFDKCVRSCAEVD